jgi:non-specific serine/threonine protein kinase
MPAQSRRTVAARAAGEDVRPQEPLVANASQTDAPWHLPAQPNELIGREAQVAGSREALMRPECRLLSLLGPGGIGKTRLALALAASVSTDFQDGVCIVDLSDIADAAAVPSLIAAHLGIHVESQDARAQVSAYLRDRQVLLLLDTFDHVLPASTLVADLLEECPRLKVLATSREPLRLRWERRLPVGPLELPDPDALPPAEQLSRIPAVALFIQRARAINMQFEASDETLRQVATLCVRLEGVPLAIELAAARTNLLSPGAILDRLEERMDVLHQASPDVPPRHRSITAVLQWSYLLFSELEQAAFRRLGVFAGTFTLGAATAIAGEDLGEVRTLDILSSLVDKGLVAFAPTADGEPRYYLLDTVRSYALETLRSTGESADVERAHAHYYLDVAEQEYARIRFAGFFVFSPGDTSGSSHPHPSNWPTRLDRDYPNLRAALTWAREHDPNLLIRLASALVRYWWVRGHLPEGRRWLEAALQLNPAAEPALRSRALGGLGIMLRQQASLERARSVFEEAVALARMEGDAGVLYPRLVNLSGVVGSLLSFDEAATLLAEAIELARARGDTWGEAVALTYLGWLEILRRDGEEAEDVLDSSLQRFRALGDLRSATVVANTLAWVVKLQGDGTRALPLIADALRWCRELGQDAIIALTVEMVAYVLSDGAEPEACARLLGAGDRLREHGYKRDTFENKYYESALAALAAHLDAETLNAARMSGRRLSAEQAVAEALTLVEHVLPSPPQARREPAKPGDEFLSERELEVLTLMVSGCSNREIGRRLIISQNTAKFHVASILTKMGARNRAEAVSTAVRRGLVRSPAERPA